MFAAIAVRFIACDADESFVAAGMCLTTLGCFVLVPLLMLVMRAAGLIG